MRKLLFILVTMMLPMVVSAANSGTCGDNLTWVYDEATQTLTISGTGAMSNYNSSSIPWKDFRNKIEVIVINDGVTTIGIDAFYECTNITSVTIPISVKSIGYRAFKNCIRLNKVIVSDIAAWCRITFEDSDANPLYYAHHLYSNEDTEITDLVIPNSVTTIGNLAFYGCSGLTSITIPNSVTSIGGSAFNGCSGLTSITIPNSVTSIGSYAFTGTPWLINQPDGLVYAGKVAYTYKGTMPDNTSITLEEGTLGIASYAFKGKSSLTSIIIPNSVVSIGSWAFYTCSGLTSITIPNSVTSIGSSAFRECCNLASVIIPNSVNYIGSFAFYETPWYNNQPDGLVYIGKVAYLYKGSMPANTKITIEDGTILIGERAFDFQKNLKSITIPNSVTAIGQKAFQYCSNLTSVIFGNSVQTIGSKAFFCCHGLKSMTIPNSVTSIGESAFLNCSGLTSVILGNGVTNIDNLAFSDCSNISDVYCYAMNVPTAESDAFYDSHFPSNITLHVPTTSIEEYKSVEPWKSFKNIVSLPRLIYQVDGEIYKITTPVIGEVIVPEAEPTKEGYTFSGWSEIPETMPAHDVIVTGTFIKDVIPGDVTGTGTVDVQDATLVVNYILGDKSNEYDYTVADMNNDGEIDVFDVQAIINVILSNDNTASARSNRAYGAGVESVQLVADNNSLLLAINNPERFTSFQFDVEVPEGMSLSDVTWTGTTDHSLQFSKTGENQYTVVALSMGSTPLPALSSGLVKLHLSDEADGEVGIDNILFVTPRGEAVHFSSSKVDVVTGIQEVTRMEDVKVYDLSGRQLKMNPNLLPKGVYIINSKKVVVK